MDEAIAGLLIILVTGILVAVVRAWTQRPRSLVKRFQESDIADDYLGDVLPSLSAGHEPHFDLDTGDHE